jgi:hypothetical protein
MIALPEISTYWKNALFRLEIPVSMSSEEYGTYWPMVDFLYKKPQAEEENRRGSEI